MTTQVLKSVSPLAAAIVARGRTVCIPHPTETKIVGYFPDGRPMTRALQQEFGPGETVHLPASEILRLRGLGYLVDSNAEELPRQEGLPADQAVGMVQQGFRTT